MKVCNKCHIEKPLDEFAIQRSRKDGRQGQCKSCRKEWYDNYYKNSPKEKARLYKNRDEARAAMRQFLNEVKNVPCADCGVKYPPYVMDFDHLGDKEFNISNGSMSLAKVKAEIEKCEVVCANCHRVRTHTRFD